METIIAVDIKSFLFSNGLISDHRFSFRPGNSTMDMQLLFSQWMEALIVTRDIRTIALDISQAFDTLWHPTLISTLSAYGIQGHILS